MRALLQDFSGSWALALWLPLCSGAICPASAWATGDLIFCNGFEDVPCPRPTTPFLVIPPRVSSGVPTPIVIFLTADPSPVAPGPPIESVDLVSSQSSQVVSLAIVSDPATPNRVEALVPAGLASGPWDVRATTNVGYVGTLPQGISITDTNTVALTGISPSVVSSTALARVTLSASNSLLPVPDVYLYQPGAPSAIRAEDREFISPSKMALFVPAGLASGTYDVIAVNPDGTAGLLSSGLVVVPSAAPLISKLVPEVAQVASARTIRVHGANLGATAPTVSAACRNPSGIDIGVAGSVATSSTDWADVVFDFSMLPADSVCRIDLTTGDGQSVSYSSLAVVSLAGHCLGSTSSVSGSTLISGRRGGVLLAGPAAPEGVRLYMIGGDSGVTSGAMASVESAAVDSFGTLAAFRQERQSLPTALTLSGGVRVGDYLYVVGGNDGATQHTGAYRARVLRDRRLPAFASIGAYPVAGGLGAGLWQYRVSPRFPAGDPDNPSGEGLPGSVLGVELPALPGGSGTQLTLTWNAVVGASGYVVYRSPTAGVGTFERLAVVGSTWYTDTGGSTSAGQNPLPLGALGAWKPLTSLNAAREGVAVTAAPDPDDASKWYVYAIGGRNSAAIVLSSHEFLPVTIAADGTQTTGPAWVSGAQALGDARAYLGAWVMDADRAPVVSAPDTYVYSGPGASAALAGVQSVDAGKVAAGGDLGAWDATPRDCTTVQIGSASAQALDCLFLMGGRNGVPAASVIAARLTSPPPGLSNWNASGSLAVGRVYAGSAVANGFIFVAGGQSSAPSAADNTVERIVQ